MSIFQQVTTTVTNTTHHITTPRQTSTGITTGDFTTGEPPTAAGTSSEVNPAEQVSEAETLPGNVDLTTNLQY